MNYFTFSHFDSSYYISVTHIHVYHLIGCNKFFS